MGARQDIYQRILLAKALLKAAADACATRNDQITFAKGILLLHDAAEAGLGAVADHLNAGLKDKTYLLDYFDLIQKADPQKREVPYKTAIRKLNTLRIDAKHHGILPDSKSNAHFPATVQALLEEICRTYLDLNFSSISLKTLIKNAEIIHFIDQAENSIREGEVEHALISAAYAMFHICESSTMPGPIRSLFEKDYTTDKPEYPRTSTVEQTVTL